MDPDIIFNGRHQAAIEMLRERIDRCPASPISIRRVESVHRPSLFPLIWYFFFFFFFLSAPWSQVAYHRAAIYSRHFTSKRQLVEINDNLLTSRLLARYAREKWNKNTITVSRERLTFHCFNLTIWWQCNVAISEKRNRLRRIRLKFHIKSVNHQKSTKIATIKE